MSPEVRRLVVLLRGMAIAGEKTCPRAPEELKSWLRRTSLLFLGFFKFRLLKSCVLDDAKGKYSYDLTYGYKLKYYCVLYDWRMLD